MENADPPRPPVSLKLKIRIPPKKQETPVRDKSPSPPPPQHQPVYTSEEDNAPNGEDIQGYDWDDEPRESDSDSDDDELRLRPGDAGALNSQRHTPYSDSVDNFQGYTGQMEDSEDERDFDSFNQSVGFDSTYSVPYTPKSHNAAAEYDPNPQSKKRIKLKHSKTKAKGALEGGVEGKSKIKLRIVGSGNGTKGLQSPLSKGGLNYPPATSLQTYVLPPRKPPKLKTLYETLPKLLAKIKKKDAYGIFLQPVDTQALPHYTSIIKHPMDLGTMGKKVESRQYSSLDQFTSDFQLMIDNCKTFNPPPSVYWTEAEKLETAGLDAIAQAAATLMDPTEEQTPAPSVKLESRNETPGVDYEYARDETDINDHGPRSSRPAHLKQSSFSLKQEIPMPPTYVQSTLTGSGVVLNNPKLRGPYRKTVMREQPMVGPDGELPGTSAGVGAYPIGSEFGNIALALEIRGRRYRTKRERQKIEKEGQPTLEDGSIDYAQMEDPFSVLSHFVPKSLDTPELEALSQAMAEKNLDAFETSVNPADFERRVSDILRSVAEKQRPVVVQRGAAPFRGVKVGIDGVDGVEEPQNQLPTRYMSHWDMGLFQQLPRSLVGDKIRKEVMQLEQSPFNTSISEDDATKSTGRTWNSADGRDGLQHIRDVVYGGVDGLAYSRSISSFVEGASPSSSNHGTRVGITSSEAMDVDEPTSESEWEEPPGGLGMSLKEYVEKHVLNPITGDFHGIVSQVANTLNQNELPPSRQDTGTHANQDVRSLTAQSLQTYPTLRRMIDEAARSRQDKLALSSLVKAPADLYDADAAWLSDPLLPQSHVAGGFTQQWATSALHVTAERILSEAEETAEKPQPVSVNGSDSGLQQRSSIEEAPELQNLRYSLITLAKFAPLSEIS
ncbi:hypothetical protein FRC03_003420 [Tulasnella sp. 419]|nr:hypothetical protein FRC03_003420 [Tulasnella sp. 419]